MTHLTNSSPHPQSEPWQERVLEHLRVAVHSGQHKDKPELSPERQEYLVRTLFTCVDRCKGLLPLEEFDKFVTLCIWHYQDNWSRWTPEAMDEVVQGGFQVIFWEQLALIDVALAEAAE